MRSKLPLEHRGVDRQVPLSSGEKALCTITFPVRDHVGEPVLGLRKS
jgi:hypothetical protein